MLLNSEEKAHLIKMLERLFIEQGCQYIQVAKHKNHGYTAHTPKVQWS